MTRFLSRLKRNQKGVAALEFAISLPLIFLLLFGVIEVTRFILVAQMVTNASRTMADLASQGETMDATELNDLFQAVRFVARPFDMQTSGKVFVSSVTRADLASPPEMNWQECQGDLTETSNIGIPGNTPTLPTGFTVRPGYTVIASEAFYDFEPILFTWIMPPTRIYRANYFRARLGALTSLSGGTGC
jgi:Flp pilus assembly protein TadG